MSANDQNASFSVHLPTVKRTIKVMSYQAGSRRTVIVVSPRPLADQRPSPRLCKTGPVFPVDMRLPPGQYLNGSYSIHRNALLEIRLFACRIIAARSDYFRTKTL